MATAAPVVAVVAASARFALRPPLVWAVLWVKSRVLRLGSFSVTGRVLCPAWIPSVPRVAFAAWITGITWVAAFTVVLPAAFVFWMLSGVSAAVPVLRRAVPILKRGSPNGRSLLGVRGHR